MTHVGYLVAGWSISLISFFIYAWRIVRKGKKLSSQVPKDRQRWMTSSTD